MHTSIASPLVYASPPSARKPAPKRRRLNHAIDLSARALTDSSNVAPTSNAPFLSLCARLSCSTCHRALPAAIRPGVAGPSICSRCAAPTCAICARTCTSYTCPASFPPTPALTRSPSPPTHATTPVSPKRATLGLSYAVMNCDSSVALSPPPVPSAKRKKAPIDMDDAPDGEIDGNLDACAGRDLREVMTMYTFGGSCDGDESIVVPGCGRVVCRACCVESVSNDGKLCVDCFSLV